MNDLHLVLLGVGAVLLVALFGYIGSEDRPADWGADALVADPGAIIAWIENHTPTGEPL